MHLRLIIADDHPMLVDGLTRLLGEMEGIILLEPAGNGAQLIERLQATPADLVLLDLHMPRMDGIAALKVLMRDFPKIKVIVFSSYNQPRLIREIKAEGAHGFLLKNSPSGVLKEAILAVARGQTWFRDNIIDPPPDSPFVDDFIKRYQLTGREVEIIQRISKGLTSKEIAGELFISEFTVNSHRRNICRKLGIYTPVGLVNFAKEHGLL
jgi:DNA-binding NarL/FixJ family response regulator